MITDEVSRHAICKNTFYFHKLVFLLTWFQCSGWMELSLRYGCFGQLAKWFVACHVIPNPMDELREKQLVSWEQNWSLDVQK
jgi:hypothetical protein